MEIFSGVLDTRFWRHTGKNETKILDFHFLAKFQISQPNCTLPGYKNSPWIISENWAWFSEMLLYEDRVFQL